MKMLKRMLNDKKFRRRIIELFSLCFSGAFGIFNGILAIMSRSCWFLMLSIYYIFLAVARLGIYHYKRGASNKSKLDSVKLYRNSGIFLLIMNFAICVSVLQIVFIEKGFNYSGLFIYTAATYAFTKITLAIINIAKTRGTNNYTEMALRSINLIDGAVSIMALQTTLLQEISNETTSINVINGITGTIVVLFTLALGIFMVLKAQREIRNLHIQGAKEH